MTRHIHAELMLDYALDWAETESPWQRWEVKISGGSWTDMSRHPFWDESHEYRRKPKPYEPTLLDQALELEIEAVRKRIQHFINTNEGCHRLLSEQHNELCADRQREMIEHLKSQGKL